MAARVRVKLTGDLYVVKAPGETDDEARRRASSALLDIEEWANGNGQGVRLHMWEAEEAAAGSGDDPPPLPEGGQER